jgi:hypothetical protein
MTVAQMAKLAAENKVKDREIADLKTKLAAHDKRAEAEKVLVDVMNDPRASLDLRPVDVEDFLAKRAEIEKLPDTKMALAAVKIAQRRSFDLGSPEPGDASTSGGQRVSTGSKADDEFANSFLSEEAAR